MCEYCDPRRYHEFDVGGANYHSYIISSPEYKPQIVNSIATDRGVLTGSYLINYCPMCGRKLNNT